jgi:hypothetical protein
VTTPPPYYGPPAGGPSAPQNTQGLVALILGIASIPLACCPYLGVPVGIAGAILGYLGKQKAAQGLATNRSQAQTGFICGIIGVVLGIVIVILSFSLSAFDWQTYINENSN